jgi:hypothetical protein
MNHTFPAASTACAECEQTTEFALVEGGELTCMICGGHTHEEPGKPRALPPRWPH